MDGWTYEEAGDLHTIDVTADYDAHVVEASPPEHPYDVACAVMTDLWIGKHHIQGRSACVDALGEERVRALEDARAEKIDVDDWKRQRADERHSEGIAA